MPARPARKPPTLPLGAGGALPLPAPTGATPVPELVKPSAPPRAASTIPPPVLAEDYTPLGAPGPEPIDDGNTTVAPPPDFGSPSPSLPPRRPQTRAPLPPAEADSTQARNATATALAERARALPAMPAVPDGAPHHAALYALQVLRARWLRRQLIGLLGREVAKDTASLDGVFGELGRAARAEKLGGKAFAEENAGIDEADRRRRFAEQALAELTGKKVDENAKFEKVERDLTARLADREKVHAELTVELGRLEAERRGLRERKRALEKQQRTLERGDKGTGNGQRDAKAMGGQIREVDAKLGKLEGPIGDLDARAREVKGDVDSRKRDLANAREGHRHRIAELEAAAAGKLRELQQSEGEIIRRTVTLGTILNLNRVDHPALGPHYARADTLRAQIHLRQGEIDRLTAERDTFDRGSVLRGAAVVLVALLVVISLVWLVLRLI